MKKVVWLAIQSASQKSTSDAVEGLANGNEPLIIEFGDRLDGHF
ncbi:hypothetical protein ACLB1R_01855 [Escherichia coli]